MLERGKDEEQSNNNTRNTGIRVKFKPSKVDFQIEESKNEEKIPIKKLSADFDSLNVNIVQNFLDYAFDKDYKARKESENYIYELYNKNNKLKIRQVYHNFGKWFEIKIF